MALGRAPGFLLCLSFTTACAAGADETSGLDSGAAPVGFDAAADAASQPDGSLLKADSGPGLDSGPPPSDGHATEAAAKDTAPEDSTADSPPMMDVHAEAAKDVGTDSEIPTTCTEADNAAGCCVGNVVYYCESTTLETKTCSGSDVCGWDSTKGYYYCVAPPGGADPSGTYPIACK
jgi:hypothetical protein